MRSATAVPPCRASASARMAVVPRRRPAGGPVRRVLVWTDAGPPERERGESTHRTADRGRSAESTRCHPPRIELGMVRSRKPAEPRPTCRAAQRSGPHAEVETRAAPARLPSARRRGAPRQLPALPTTCARLTCAARSLAAARRPARCGSVRPAASPCDPRAGHRQCGRAYALVALPPVSPLWAASASACAAASRSTSSATA